MKNSVWLTEEAQLRFHRTHDQLIGDAQHWLRVYRQCSVVLVEKGWGGTEICDVIGWCERPNGSLNSILVECKSSVEDFVADKKKPHRQYPALGLGRERWFITPPFLLIDEMFCGTWPAGWGLVETDGERFDFDDKLAIPFDDGLHCFAERALFFREIARQQRLIREGQS